MAMKRFMTKAEMFELKVRKIVSGSIPMTSEEAELIRKQATLIAAFCSSVSWENFKRLKSGECPGKINFVLLDDLWKKITASDVVEIANMSATCEPIVKKWILLSIHDENERRMFFKAWEEFKKEFSNGKVYTVVRRRSEKSDEDFEEDLSLLTDKLKKVG